MHKQQHIHYWEHMAINTLCRNKLIWNPSVTGGKWTNLQEQKRGERTFLYTLPCHNSGIVIKTLCWKEQSEAKPTCSELSIERQREQQMQRSSQASASRVLSAAAASFRCQLRRETREWYRPPDVALVSPRAIRHKKRRGRGYRKKEAVTRITRGHGRTLGEWPL